MTYAQEAELKVHYICQTYAENTGEQGNLHVDKLFQYTSAAHAHERATREFASETCVGADAYMLAEDPNSGEVGSPEFFARLGLYPEFEDF